MRSVFVVIIAMHVIACGRIGFDAGSDITDAGADSSVPTDRITISLRGAPEDPDEGLPVEGATVVLQGPSGDATYATDAAGLVAAAVDGPTTIHIGYRLEGTGPWRLYTLAEVPGGTAVTIGHGMSPSVVVMSVTVPVMANANRYEMHGPRRCAIEGISASAVVTSAVNRCLGDTVPIYASVYNNLTPLGWLDAGLYVAAQASYTTTATWQPMFMQTLRYANLPVSIAASAELARVFDSDDRVFVGTGTFPANAANPEQAFGTFGSAADIIYVTYSDQSAVPQSTAILTDPAPALIGDTRTFDAARFADLVSAPLVVDATGIGWSIRPMSRALVAVLVDLEYITLQGVEARWVFTGPPRTRVDLPVLAPPLDEIAATPGTLEGFVVGFELGGRTYDEMAGGIIDSLLGFAFVGEVPLGWAISLVQTDGGTKRTTPPSRLQRHLRAITGAD